MSKRGRPKKVVLEQDIPMLQKDLVFESQKPKMNHNHYKHHLDSVKKERLEKGLKALYELAFNERLPDTKAKALAEVWRGKV